MTTGEKKRSKEGGKAFELTTQELFLRETNKQKPKFQFQG